MTLPHLRGHFIILFNNVDYLDSRNGNFRFGLRQVVCCSLLLGQNAALVCVDDCESVLLDICLFNFKVHLEVYLNSNMSVCER